MTMQEAQHQERVSGWQKFFTDVGKDPNALGFLVAMGSTLTRPTNLEPVAQVNQALVNGMAMMGLMSQSARERARQANEEQLATRRVAVAERGATAEERRTMTGEEALEVERRRADIAAQQARTEAALGSARLGLQGKEMSLAEQRLALQGRELDISERRLGTEMDLEEKRLELAGQTHLLAKQKLGHDMQLLEAQLAAASTEAQTAAQKQRLEEAKAVFATVNKETKTAMELAETPEDAEIILQDALQKVTTYFRGAGVNVPAYTPPEPELTEEEIFQQITAMNPDAPEEVRRRAAQSRAGTLPPEPTTAVAGTTPPPPGPYKFIEEVAAEPTASPEEIAEAIAQAEQLRDASAAVDPELMYLLARLHMRQMGAAANVPMGPR
jgi:hypothetical protein